MNTYSHHYHHIKRHVNQRSGIRLGFLILFLFIFIAAWIFFYRKEMSKRSDIYNQGTQFAFDTKQYNDGISIFQIMVKKEKILLSSEQGSVRQFVFDAGINNILYVITLQVQNNNTFPYRFDESMIRIRGEDGREYLPLEDENALFAYDLSPGEIRQERLVFRIPQHVKKPVFAVKSKYEERGEIIVELR